MAMSGHFSPAQTLYLIRNRPSPKPVSIIPATRTSSRIGIFRYYEQITKASQNASAICSSRFRPPGSSTELNGRSFVTVGQHSQQLTYLTIVGRHPPAYKSRLRANRNGECVLVKPRPREVFRGLRTDHAVTNTAVASSGGRNNDLEDEEGMRGAKEAEEVDVVVIGAGLGGLCCASLLAKYGLRVVVCESHSAAGGAAHSFVRRGFHFDSGPSFHAGLSLKRSLNPLKHVLDILEEEVDCVQYKTWIGYFPGGEIFRFRADASEYQSEIARVGGEVARREWLGLEKRIRPLAEAAAALPASALRSDPTVVFTLARFLPNLIRSLPATRFLLDPFSSIVDEVVTDPFLRRLIDLECFVLSGMLADSTITAEMAFMFFERNRPEGSIDYPMGGGGAIIDALIRGLEKNGGTLLLNTHVDEIMFNDGRAAGVKISRTIRGRKQKKSESEDRKARMSVGYVSDWSEGEEEGGGEEEEIGGRGGDFSQGAGSIISARRAVVSNASVWDTVKLLPHESGQLPSGIEKFRSRAAETKQTNSFMHLHLGIDNAGLPPDLQCHHLVVNDWEGPIDAPQNVVIISIPTVFDSSLAPAGCHVVHVYTAGNEPFAIWEGLERGSEEYEALKRERSQVLWEALEKVIPDVRDRVVFQIVGTPLTHARYLRRHRGTYGPSIKAGKEVWPGPRSEVPGLLCCGDSTMPGIGVPAVAASGLIAANSLLSLWDHFDMLDRIEASASS